jgi:hypothetical protein
MKFYGVQRLCSFIYKCRSGEVVALNLPVASNSTATEIVGKKKEDLFTSSLHNPVVEPPKPPRFTNDIKDKFPFL